VIGVDLGGTKLLAGVVGPDLQVGARVRHRVDGLPREELLSVLAGVVSELRSEDVAAVGIGLPALFDGGRIAFSVHHDLTEAQLDVGLPVVLDNDSNCAMLAEWRGGAARGCSDAVSLSLGTGIGGGLVLGGRLYRGARGLGAELGHIVVDADGPPCFGACPGRGCLEALASGSALARDGSRLLGRAVDGGEVAALAAAGDPAALAAVASVARGLGAGLASLMHAFDPEVIVVGGGVMRLGETLLGPARASMLERLQPPYRERAKVVAAAFGEDAAMIGAALLAMESLA
jgi:glucokinase